jgi:hypothetical protein
MSLVDMETRFMQKYRESETDTERLRYLRYFNHIAAMRNRLEFNLKE